MPETINYLAVDLGASSGRVMLGRWDGERDPLYGSLSTSCIAVPMER